MTSLYERRLRKPRLLFRSTTILAFRFFWVIIILWCELGVFFYSLSDCRWPDDDIKSATRSPSEVTPTHVLLVADARLRNPAISAPHSWFSYNPNLSYLRKSWRVASRLRPNVVMFLGDTFASGRYIDSETEHDAYHHTFETTFPRHASTPFYLIPGNNDIGLGDSSTFSKNARHFFEERFGPTNRVVSIAGHQFVLLNAPGLVEEDYRRHAHGRTYDHWAPLPGGPIEFVMSISDQANELAAQPKILLSHIPLSRPSSKSCGPLREKGTIRKGAGHGYQTMLGKQTTDFLLNVLRPSVVFSGDNRDYCEIMHELPGSDLQANMVREVTVKSFSPSRHIRRPGFQLLSLVPPSSSPTGPTFADVQCLLPDTRRIYHFIYFPCLVLTVLALLYVNFIKLSRRSKSISLISLRHYRPSSPLPEPDSAIWATRTPIKSRTQTSPTAPLPLSTRIHSTKSVASYRASPVSTPHGSPLLSPIALFQSGDERDAEEEYVGPSHYSHVLPSSGWHGEHDDSMDMCDVAMALDRHRLHARTHSHLHPGGRSMAPATGPYFLPPPLSQHTRALWSFTWSFVFRGRRRRMTVGVPDWRAWRSWLSGSTSAVSTLTSKGYPLGRGRGQGHQPQERGLLWRVVSDCANVAWPAVVAWIVVRWMFF